ncbi:MAG TPA: hypothetical protein DIW24_03160 [Bacteroidetes bacterium]|mgnify:CR=1 FL=1|nr:hypothetical protein [Bacteroidota bacterium]HRR07693.1 hypothetical protein [Rhodothermales bacterium]
MRKIWILSFAVLGMIASALLIGGLTPPTAHAGPQTISKIFWVKGCAITIKMENKSTANILVSTPFSKVKIKNGLWARVWPGYVDSFNVPAKGNITESSSLDLGCDIDRQYKFRFWRTKDGVTSNLYHYYPSEDGFTRKTTIDLGNIGRFFD